MSKVKCTVKSPVNYTKYRWFVLVALFIITTATSIPYIGPAPIIPSISKATGWDIGATTAIIMMLGNLATALACIASGALLDKLGVAKTWLICGILIAVGSLLVPVIGSTIPGLAVARIIQVAGNGPILGSITAACAQWFKYEERTYVAAVQGFSVSVGVAAALALGPAFYTISGSWQGAFGWFVLPGVVIAVLSLIIVLGPKPPVAHSIKVVANDNKTEFKRALGSATIYVLILMAFIDIWTQQAFNDLAPGYYAADVPLGLGFGPVKAGALLLLYPIISALGTLVGPVLNEKVFKGKPQPTISIGLVLGAIFVFTIRLLNADQTTLLVIIPCLIMFFTSFVNPTVFGYISKHYPESIAGKLGGMTMGIGIFGNVLGIGISSALLTVTHSYKPAMNVMTVICVVGAIVVLFLKPPKGFSVAEDEANKKAA